MADYSQYDPADFDAQSAELARRRRLAQLLQQQAMGYGNQIVNRQGRASILAPLAAMFQAYAGSSMEKDASEQAKALERERMARESDLISGFGQKYQALPERPDMNLPGDLAPLAQPEQQAPTTQPTEPMVPKPPLDTTVKAPALIPPPPTSAIERVNLSGGTPRDQFLNENLIKANLESSGQAPDTVAQGPAPLIPQAPMTQPGPSQPSLIPKRGPDGGLILPAQPATLPTAQDYTQLAASLPAGPTRQRFMDAALKNMLTEPDKVAARQAQQETLRAHYTAIDEQRKATELQKHEYFMLKADSEAARRAETERYHRVLEELARGRLDQGQQRIDLHVAGNAAPEVPGDFSKKGDEYLASLPPEDAAVVKKIAAGEIPLTTFSTRGGHREALAKMVSQYDPSYNATRPTMWREFTSGATGKNITSINTAIAHMGTMSDLVTAMQNGDIPAVNKLVNFIAVQTGDNKVTNTETARQAVGEELMRTFRVVGASEHEAQAWMDRFKTASSPQQLQGALKTAGELLGGRIKAVNDNWKRGTQSDKDFPNIIPPENQAVLNRLGVKQSALPSSAAAATGAPVRINSDAEYNALPKGTQFIGPDGKIREKP